MRSRWILRGFEIALLATIVIAGFGQAVLQLWNLLMPDIFGLRPISFWQAVGLLALSWILFGGLGMFRRPGYRRHWQDRMAERLEQMPPEQRDKFRQGLKGGCGRVKVPTADPKARPEDVTP
jgi:hypothetical protein